MKKILANVSRQLPSATLGMFAIILLSMQASPSFATLLNRGTFIGTNVDYVDVSEGSATDPGLVVPGPLGGLFGVPTIAGDTLDFNPKGFAATASGGAADTTDGNLQMQIAAHPGKAITSIAFSERGDTRIAGFADALTTVTATVFVEIDEVNGLPASINLPAASMTFTPFGGYYQLSAIGGIAYTTDWQGSVLIDIGPYLPVGVFATKVSVSLDNTLVALSLPGSTAFIQKKDFDGVTITVETNDIPEPASFALAIMCLTLISTQRRRSS